MTAGRRTAKRGIPEGAIGVGLRPAHFSALAAAPANGRPAWLEVVSENYFGVGGAPRRNLEAAHSRLPIAIHGVGLSIGSIDDVQPSYLSALEALVELLDPPFVSDHLCWTRHRGQNTHDLMPVPYTSSTLARIADRVSAIQDTLGRRLYLENPSAYVGFAVSTMAEHEFLAALVRRTKCGVLLDVNNLYVNSQNHGASYPAPSDYMAAFVEDDLCYFHLAGHATSKDEETGITVRVDTHDRAVPEGVWTLYRQAVARFPGVPTLVEWDADLPSFEELMVQATRAAAERDSALREAARSPAVRALFESRPDGATALDADAAVARLADSLRVDEAERAAAAAGGWLASDSAVPGHLGLRVYQDAYFLRLIEVAGDTYRGVKKVLGPRPFARLVEAHIRANPPTDIDVTQAVATLAQTLAAADIPELVGVSKRAVVDLANVEWAYSELMGAPDEASPVGIGALQEIDPDAWETVRFDLLRAARVIACEHDVLPAFQAVLAEEDPPRPEALTCHILAVRPALDGDDCIVPMFRIMAQGEAAAWTALSRGESMVVACSAVAAALGGGDAESQVATVVGWLARWTTDGLVRGIRVP